VLFLTDSLSDLDGVGRYAMRLIGAMEALEPGLEVEVLLARKHRPTSRQVPARWRVSVALPPDYFFYMSPARFWASYAAAVWRTRGPARRADVVHAIKDYPHSLVALRAAQLAGKPCVATAHGTYTVQPLLDPRHAARARRTYRDFDALISVSGYTRRRLFEVLGEGALDPARVHVVPNCVDAEHYAAPRAIGARPWHAHPFTLGIGELKERKGHHLALAAWCRAAARHPEVHHYVVGRPSGDAYEERLHALARDAGMADRVHFLGNVEEDEKIDLLQRALVFVHTPVTAADGGFEGFGIVYLEASASGTAVLGTLGCGAEDAIRDGETGLLAAQDVASVEAALGRLLDDAALRERLAAAGPGEARRRTWTENAGRVLRLYRDALAARGRAAAEARV
jgi:phosphatidylinositol alpha-1,6-mannosyltransferase